MQIPQNIEPIDQVYVWYVSSFSNLAQNRRGTGNLDGANQSFVSSAKKSSAGAK